MVNVLRALQERSGTTTQDIILEVIRSLNIIGFGIIVNAYERDPDEDGMYNGVYADIRLLDGAFIKNAEVLFIGNRSSVIDCAPANKDPCIVFGTKQNIASISDMLFSPSSVYGDETVKVLPLGSIVTAAARLVLGNGVSLTHKNASLGIGADGVLFSKSVDDDGRTTRDEAYYPDGSLRKAYNSLKAVEIRNADYSAEWTLYDDIKKIIEYEKRDTEGNYIRLEGENTDINTDFAIKKWKYEKTKSVKEGYTKTETVKDAAGKILYRRIFNKDGSIEYSLYEQSAGGGNFLVTQKTNADGSFQRTLTDGLSAVCDISIGADGAMSINIGNGQTFFELKPDGNIAMTLGDGLTLSITGDVTIESNAKLAFKSTASSKKCSTRRDLTSTSPFALKT